MHIVLENYIYLSLKYDDFASLNQSLNFKLKMMSRPMVEFWHASCYLNKVLEV